MINMLTGNQSSAPRRLLLTVLVFLWPGTSMALDCNGRITEIYSWPNKCNGHYAYKTDNNNSRWFCSVSDKSDALVLLAYSTNKMVRTRVAAGGETCTNLTQDFLVHDFIRILNTN